jgi:hypothetical protein
VNKLHPLDGSNWTNIIFSIVPFPENATISSTWLSILRSKFMSLVVRQSTIHLTKPLFGNSSYFEVIKFPGGITIIPPQTAFLLQKPHATFNFTLNYPIYKLQDRTNELKDQMEAGLLLNPYEVSCTFCLLALFLCVCLHCLFNFIASKEETYVHVRFVHLILLATLIMLKAYRHLVFLALHKLCIFIRNLHASDAYNLADILQSLMEVYVIY